MTFAPVTQHFSVSTALCTQNQNIFFLGKDKKPKQEGS
jgi:hypothetical protein